MRCNNYHSHKIYSNIKSLDVVAKPIEYIVRAIELDGKDAIYFTTEHGYQGNVYEAHTLCGEVCVKLTQENNEYTKHNCEKCQYKDVCDKSYKGIKMVVGAEVYYVKDRKEKDNSNYHLVIIAKNKDGYRDLNRILSYSNIDGVYYKNRIDDELLFSVNPNNVIITTACVAGRLRNDEGLDDWIIKMKEYFGDNFYLEVQNHNEDIQKNLNRKIICLSEKYNINIIHGNDSHYINPQDYIYRELFLKAKGIIYKEETNFILDYPNVETIIERYNKQNVLSEEQIKVAINNTLIFDECENIVLDKEIKMPSISDNPNKELKDIINKRWVEIRDTIPKERWNEYLDAIKYEFNIIEKTHMEDYFILDYKICQRAINKYNGLLTKTGRGCFTEDALVHTKNSLKSIKDVKIGDYVITENGNFNKVINTAKYDIEEELVQIKHIYGTDKHYPTVCTLDHKILINRNNTLKWIQAKDIVKTDYVCVPKINVTDNLNKIIDLNDYNINGFDFDDKYIYERTNTIYKYSPSDVARKIGVGKSLVENFANMKKNCFNRKRDKYKALMDYIPFNTQEEYSKYVKSKQFSKLERYIEIDKEFNIFIGLMYGDGFTSKNTSIGLAINNTTEKDKCNREIFYNIASKLNKSIYENVSKTKKLSQLYINSTVFCNFVKQELFESKKGKDKIFNEKWFNQSKENLLGIVKGLRLSDGSFCEYRINFDNTSKSLINAYKLLCLMTDEGVNSLSVRKEHKTKEGYLCKESYKLRLNKNSNHSQKKNERTFEDNNYYYLPIKEIIILPKQKTTVYDIEVENEHSYLLNNMIVHNSAVSFIINKLLGLTEIDRLSAPVPLYPTRFMSIERILGTRSLPDVDLNTEDRSVFIQATKDLLGEENCAWILSYKPLQDSSAFRLWCKANDMHVSKYDEIAKNLEQYENDEYWGKIIKDSKVFKGVVESISESPCSMLLYDKNVSEEIGLIKTKEGICCNLDGYNCDVYKYLKNDYLAVTVWTLIRKTCELANIKIPTIKELEKMLDEKTFKIYEDKITCTINQSDSDFATNLASRYKVSSVAEMSAFVASIRPGFASLLDNFIERKPYTTGVKELDNLLEDSYHYLMYQESIMKYLIWLGIPEPETYGIIKKISKKKFKEKELIELEKKLKKGWIDKVGSIDGFEETWQVVNDASKYSFNASHSLSYAYDSLYGAFLKSHYPLEYYTVALSIYSDDSTRTNRLIKELSYFDIKLLPPKFRYSKAEYFMDKESNSIYKGMASIKYMNEQVSQELYMLKDNKYDSFMDLLIDLNDKTSINSRQLNILITIDFFDEFGKSQKLLDIIDLYEKIMSKKLKSKKGEVSFNKTDLPYPKEIIEKYATEKSKEDKYKQYKVEKALELCNELMLNIEDNEMSSIDKVKINLEMTGECNYYFEDYDSSTCIVIDVITKFKNKKAWIFNISTGKTIEIKVGEGIYEAQPFKAFSVINVYHMFQKAKKEKKEVETIDKDGNTIIKTKWVQNGEFEIWCDEYHLLNEEEIEELNREEYEYRKANK